MLGVGISTGRRGSKLVSPDTWHGDVDHGHFVLSCQHQAAPPPKSVTVRNFTPNFPSYVSGHATFGSALFQILRRYYGTDDIAFRFQSDEFNGVTRDQTGAVRPPRTREYANLTQPELENHDSRIYLGVHWRFDQDEGLKMGRAIGDFVFDTYPLPR